MSARLAILTGTLAGQTRALGSVPVSLGRDPRCDVRFDPTADPEVSARHAEVRLENGVAIVRDTNSTNGVYVNDTRIRGEQALADGDVVRLGARGPQIRFEAAPAAAPAPPKGSTTQRIAVAVARQTRGLRAALAGCVLLAIGASTFGLVSARRADEARTAELERLSHRNDSLSMAIDSGLHSISSRIAGVDSALGAARPMDYAKIASTSGKAVVMIAVEMGDGELFSGSGVGVTAAGAIVTNRHLIRSSDGGAPRRIAVAYADTRDWLPAHVERVAGDADLAVLRIDREGPFPFVDRVAERAPAVGAPVAIIGFPLGDSIATGGRKESVAVRSTLGTGTVSKAIPGVLQIDAFASEGSSGSPVFDGSGAIAGIVYGGARAAAGRIVYAVPAADVAAVLRAGARHP